MSITTTVVEYVKGSQGVLDFSIYNGKSTNETPLDISGYTATFYAVHREDPTHKFSGAMSVVNPTLGKVSYEVQTADFPTIGLYDCEIVLDNGQPLPLKIRKILINCVSSIADQFADEGGA